MLKPEHWKWFRRLFRKGTNSDIDPRQLPEDEGTDSFNMRAVSDSGNTGSLVQIGGESITFQHDAMPGASTYWCIGSVSVNRKLVSFWANSDSQFPPIVEVAGTILAMSSNIPYVYDRPLQIAVVADCKGGVVYPADHNSDPLFWDIANMELNGPGQDNTQVYFSGYTTDVNSVGLNAAPVVGWLNRATPLVDLGGPIGMFPGQVSYSFRWKTVAGDATNWGPETPLIPIPGQYQPATENPTTPYVGARTMGWEPSVIRTPYGVMLEFRVDNPFGYASIQVKRRSYVDGAGLTGAGVEEIIATIPVDIGEVSIRTFIDPSNANIEPPELVPPNEADNPIFFPKNPKTVEYANNRLMYGNFNTDGQPSDINFITKGGRIITSFTRALRTMLTTGERIPDGYNNPYHGTYLKTATRGEAYGYAVACYGGSQARFFAITDPELQNYQHPNRGDIKGANGNWGADSLTYSDDPCWSANVNLSGGGPEGPVGATFEATTQGNRAKTDLYSPINVQAQTASTEPGEGAVRDIGQFNAYANGIPPGFEAVLNAPFGPIVVRPTTGGYEPWKPVNNQDSEDTYKVPPVVSRVLGPAASTTWTDQCFAFNPLNSLGQVFGPTYHSLGALIYGLDKIPSSVSAFTIARTAPAGRVVAQGMGSWVLNPNTEAPATKTTNAVYVHFPDLQAGMIDQATIDAFIQNPGILKAQVVAGRGIYNEVYGYSGEAYTGLDSPWCGPCIGAHIMDVLTHARVQHDTGQVNVGEAGPGGMGYNPILGSPAPIENFVGIDKYRRNGPMQGDVNLPNYSYWQEPGNDGNSLLDVTSIVPVTDGRSNFFRITFAQYINSPESFSLGTTTGFSDDTVRNFQTPFLVVNLIRENASVPQANSTPLVNTGCTVVMKTTLGFYESGIQDFRLLGEREAYDCTNFLPTDYRYVYVIEPDFGEKRYLCVTGNTQLNLAAILSDINSQGYWVDPDGNFVYGLYDTYTDTNQTSYVRLGVYNTIPQEGSKIVIKYDNTAPLRVFGHEATIGPSIHAVLDREATRDSMANAFFLGGLPLLTAGFGMNPRYFLPERGTQTEEQININYLVSLRQWCILWDAESRSYPAMYLNLNSTPNNRLDLAQFYPASAYRIRPMQGPFSGNTAAANGFFPQYDQDFPDEWAIFNKGGLRFLPEYNLDYAKQPDVEFFTLPQRGYIDRTDYCNGIIASNVFLPTQQDSPGLRTFQASGLHLVSPETGEIKMIASMTDGTIGQNIYFWTQYGWGYVLTLKNVLTGASGEVVGLQAVDAYWNQEVFKSREIGMPDQLWRLASRGSADAGNTIADTLMWADYNGVYRAVGSNFYPIADEKWLKNLLPNIESIGTGYDARVSGTFDKTKQEYLIGCISPRNANDQWSPYVYSTKRNQWGGSYGHRFDRMAVNGTRLYGMRGLRTFQLDGGGFQQNGQVMTAYGEAPFCPEPGVRYEAVAFRVHPSKPSRIEVYNKDHNLIFFTDQPTQEAFEPGTGFLWVKQIDGWENEMGRSNPSLDPEVKRLQDELFFVRVIYSDDDERHVLMDTQLQLKRLV